jgi:hypothetical protein
LTSKAADDVEELGETKEMVRHLNSENERLIDEINDFHEKTQSLKKSKQDLIDRNEELNSKL